MPARPASSFDFSRILPIFAIVSVDILGLTLLLPLLHLYAAAFGATPLEIGLVAAAFPAAQIIGVPFMGALSDRYGRKPLLLISQITTCISFLMLAFANSLWMILASRLLDGIFGANLATAQAAISDLTAEEDRARGLGLIGAAFGIGFLIGPAIALIMFELTQQLAMPAITAAAYSFLSILLTLFAFRETLPADQRRRSGAVRRPSLLGVLPYLRNVRTRALLVLMFAQQLVFYGFESLLGVFTLTRLGLLAQGNAFIFVWVGVILVWVQVRFIGKWTRKYGEVRLVRLALGLLAIGLILTALTPMQPHPLYNEREARLYLLSQRPSSTEAVIGALGVTLPSNDGRGVGGLLWLMAALLPLSVGAALIRPAINSLLTRRADGAAYGGVLGASAAAVSAADAIAPLIFGALFQAAGSTLPFLMGGICLGILWWLRGRAMHSVTFTAPTVH
ncbi:MAG: MFS transporter [Chloroflexi bacterium CFX4]|nr:MFS transporter [Chloroflexi bacterium CFX4]MDL1923606.1 MFS transporter [Chloroflexi bacterium CFX3]